VYLERGLDLIVTLLAILKAGGVYVPLDGDCPNNRLSLMMDDVVPDCLVTDSNLHAMLPDSPCPTVCLDKDAHHISAQSATTPAIELSPDNAAYIIFTSGSTGTPKGAINTHRAICNRLQWMQETYRLDSGDRVLHKTPLSFDVSIWELFWPLMTDATQMLAVPGGHKDSAYLVKEIAQSRISIAHFVPSMLAAFLEEAEVEKCVTLRHVICSGETLSPEMSRRFFAKLKADLHNLYGPTEAAVDVTAWRCRREDTRTHIPIGRPISNTGIYILGQNGHPVCPTEIGEIYISGVALARAYIGHPGLTARSFLPDACSGVPGARLYATGDLGRHASDGVIEYLGRRDGQIKIRGQRVEIGEIESALLNHEFVRQAAVVYCKNPEAGGALIAYLTTRTSDELIDETELREFLNQHIPEHMVPDIFVQLESFPTLSNGKIDRRNLPEARHDSVDETQPRNLVERVLLQIWLDVLSVPRLGIFDNFFRMGGDSILALQVVARARKSGFHIEARQLFSHPTIATLAMQIRSAPGNTDAEQGVLFGPVPLTPIQKSYLQSGLTEPVCLTQSILLDLAPEIDASRIRSVLPLILQHHDALRLRFKQTNGSWEQWYSQEFAQSVFEEIRIEGDDERELDAMMRSACKRAEEPLKLETGPLVRVLFVSLGTHVSAKMFIVVHHLVIDGVSWRILLDDLHTLLDQTMHTQPLVLASKTASYRQWARRLEMLSQETDVVEQAYYWKELGRRFPASKSNFSIRRATEGDTLLMRVKLDRKHTNNLLRFLAKSHADLRMDDLLIAALAHRLCLLHGLEFVRIDLEQHGRDEDLARLDLSRTIGWFTAVSPFIVRANHNSSVIEYAAAVRRERMGDPKSSIFGILRYLSEDQTVQENLRHLPTAFALFNYFGRFDQFFSQMKWFHPAPEGGRPERASSALRPYPLEVDAMIYVNELSIGLCYDPRAGTEAEIGALCTSLLSDLKGISTLGENTQNEHEGIRPFPGLNINSTELQAYIQRLAAKTDEARD
jgi:amino acid adenylation domain-containing protein/non-ribosomal peptide synthase protein (TIGR01720 family)